MTANRRLALASGFNGSGGGDGGNIGDQRIASIFYEIMGSDRRSSYANPHEMLATLDQGGKFIGDEFCDVAKGHLVSLPRVFPQGGDLRFSAAYLDVIKERVHLMILKHQKDDADRAGSWLKADLDDIEVCLAHKGGDNPMARAFMDFSGNASFAMWRKGLSVAGSAGVVLGFSGLGKPTHG